MPAPFTVDLCGYRADGKPNTADGSNPHSVAMGNALFARLGIPVDQPEPAGKVGSAFDKAVAADLTERLGETAPHLTVKANAPVHEYEQYAHLTAMRALATPDTALPTALKQLRSRIETLAGHQDPELQEALSQMAGAAEAAEHRRRTLLELLGNETVLQLDVAVHRPTQAVNAVRPHLVAGLSIKWSLRTDRLQDPRSQGARMSAVRRGRMPHFAAITMEPRPYFLSLLARGSGDLDCVYHLDLPKLIEAVDEVCAGRQQQSARDEFRRLVDQRRIRDYDDLVTYLSTL